MSQYRIKSLEQFKKIIPLKLSRDEQVTDAIAIVRRSSDGQKDNNSEAVQLETIQRYAADKKLNLLAIFCIIESAKSSEDRKLYQAIEEWADANKLKHRVFYKPDRETRNLTDIEKSLNRVRIGEIIVHYALENKVLDENIIPSEMLQRSMVGVFDAHYSNELRHKIAEGQRKKAEGGEFPGCVPPLGYEHEKMKNKEGYEKRRGARIVVSRDASKIRLVRREFELRASGMSFAAIREQIIREGLVPVEKIFKYRHTSIQKRIENTFYSGTFNWDGVQYKGNYDLIIPPEILYKVQTLSGIRGQYSKNSGAAFSNGWLKCFDVNCGCNIVADPKTKKIKTTGETKTYYYYHCTNGKGIHKNLKGMNVTESKIWDQLSSSVSEISIPEDWGKQLATALNETKLRTQRAIKTDIENFKSALLGLQNKENRLYDRLDSGEIDRVTYNLQRIRLHEEQLEFTNKMEKSQLQITDAGMETAQSILELAINAESLWKSRSPSERKEFLDLILSNRTLDGVTIRYELKKPFKTLSEMKGNKEWRIRRKMTCFNYLTNPPCYYSTNFFLHHF